MADTMQTTTPTKAVATPKQANLLACRQWWKVCFLYGDQEKYYRQVYGRAASQRMATMPEKPLKNNNNNGDASSNNSSNENLLNAVESGSATTTTGNKSSPNKEMLLFPHKNHKGILIKHSNGNRNRPPLDPLSGTAADLTQNNSRVTVLDDPFLLGLRPTHDSKDSGINNIDDPPPPPLPAKTGPRQQQPYQYQQRSPQQQRFQLQHHPQQQLSELPQVGSPSGELQLNGGFDFDLLTFQLANRHGNSAEQNSVGGGAVVNHQYQHNYPNNSNNTAHNLGTPSNADLTVATPPQMWRNYRAPGDNSPNGTVQRPPPPPPLSLTTATLANASVGCGNNGTSPRSNNSGLCSQIDKILEHNNLQNEM